jgi:hypothetical protein
VCSSGLTASLLPRAFLEEKHTPKQFGKRSRVL